ncbi:MAG: hypothetical protein KGJ53_05850 [Alphaproteobacteria bacterium]|nr:hypothetical protein [Alphaproteobacteria bacterium]MDE2162664.1 hypothetical protein [Alphaproteobacteria bacterium]
MWHVVGCITGEHDLRLVALAAVLCLFASATTLGPLERARAGAGNVRALWVSGAGVVFGSGIWATHFVAMLAYQAGFPFAYDISRTVLSIIVAIVLSGLGFALALKPRFALVGGAVVGAAICAMHYIGMAALHAPAVETWNMGYVTASLVIGVVVMAVGMAIADRARALPSYAAAAVIFTIAICGMHFTGMSAVAFTYDPTIAAPQGVMDPATLAIAVAAIATLIVGLGLIMTMVDHHLAGRAEQEAVRMRSHIARLEATRAKLEETLHERAVALAKADEASRAKADFFAGMSHELRTPLNAVIGFSEMIMMQPFGPIGDVRYRDYACDINKSGGHLLALINDILDLSRLEAGKSELREEHVDLRAVVCDAMRMVEPQALTTGLSLVEDVPAELPRLLADERRLKQVLINLLSNAVKFTPADGRVTVSVRRLPQGMQITVADTGIGIPPDEIAHVLQPFYQADSTLAREHAGTGLGLPLAKQLIELHGGSMTLESRQNAGTVVTVLLPASRILDEAAESAA